MGSVEVLHRHSHYPRVVDHPAFGIEIDEGAFATPPYSHENQFAGMRFKKPQAYTFAVVMGDIRAIGFHKPVGLQEVIIRALDF